MTDNILASGGFIVENLELLGRIIFFSIRENE